MSKGWIVQGGSVVITVLLHLVYSLLLVWGEYNMRTRCSDILIIILPCDHMTVCVFDLLTIKTSEQVTVWLAVQFDIQICFQIYIETKFFVSLYSMKECFVGNRKICKDFYIICPYLFIQKVFSGEKWYTFNPSCYVE